MDILPAIDLKDGSCVRLKQGSFDAVTVYEKDPLHQARIFAKGGAEWVHVVDLDGARTGEMHHAEAIAELARQTPLKIQVGGGVRSEETIEHLLKANVERVVIGSLAVKNRALVQKWLGTFGADRLVLAFDVRFKDGQPEVMTHGWQNGSQQLLWDVLDAYEQSGLQNILCTDVGRDGMMTGANVALYESIRNHAPQLRVQASGGITTLKGIEALRDVPVSGAVIGKALYEGRLDLQTAIEKAKHAG
ncbi:MAG: 1-(5-phosphoribosyl)-5-[(5-phosphoribosylamino)methylideneamino]imidazole-4-carboxamide isomerase [Alphaproteobacteria bacterium]|nr:1-(5-phosphoribosyl)-5-[(5-phosphoribosylamino)methylideneamino]imidazole-4-carboxamide isomerase [Alphaproteobacteria bacterium]